MRAHEEPRQRASLRLVVNAGSVLENDRELGFAHFVEHMAFNGTRLLPKHEIVDFIEKVGMRFGHDANASTSFDETIYMLEVPTDDAAVLAKAFLVLSQIAGDVSFDPEEVDRERGVIIEEWRLGRGAGTRVHGEGAARDLPRLALRRTAAHRHERRSSNGPPPRGCSLSTGAGTGPT